MKRITNQVAVDKAALLTEIIEKRRALDREEAEIKAYFKAQLTDGTMALVGSLDSGWMISLSERTRANFDMEALKRDLGDKIGQYQTTTSYMVFDIKGINKAQTPKLKVM